jgi:hypothetical protein
MSSSPRFTALVASAVVIVCGLSIMLVACRSPVGVDRMTSELWREDLRYLARELPKRHGNAFHQVSETDFETAVNDLDRQLPDLEHHEVAVELGRLVALIGDGHTELWLPQRASGFKRYPMALYLYGDELHVIAGTEAAREAIGRQVIAIDGVPASEAYRRVIPLIARDNDAEYLRSGPLYLVVPEVLHAVGVVASVDRAVFTLAGPEGPEEVTIAAEADLSGATWTTARDLGGAPIPLHLQRGESYYWYEYLEDERTVYVKYNRCRNEPGRESIKRFARELFAFVDRSEVERFVIDLRHNTGGNFHRNRPLIVDILERPEINRRGRLFVITSRTTFSAATIAAIDLKRETEALIVGEPSRGRPNGYSDEKHLELPNSGLQVNYSPLYRAAMPELGDSPYLPVDIPVEARFEDYRAGRDRALETILSWPPGAATGTASVPSEASPRVGSQTQERFPGLR